MMRREIMLAVTGAVMAAGGFRAQQRVLPVVGLLGSEAPGSFGPLLAEFHQGLSDAGYVEGQNLTIEYAGRRAAKIGCPHWPPILSAVESTSSRRSILQLPATLKLRFGMGYLFVSNDLMSSACSATAA